MLGDGVGPGAGERERFGLIAAQTMQSVVLGDEHQVLAVDVFDVQTVAWTKTHGPTPVIVAG